MNHGPQQPHTPGGWQGQGTGADRGPAPHPGGSAPGQDPAQDGTWPPTGQEPAQGGGERTVLHGQVIPSARQDPSQRPFVPQQPVPPDPTWAPPVPQPHQPHQPHQRMAPPGPPEPPGSAGAVGEPDWSALAEENEAGSRRRRRMLAIGGGALAATVVAGIVATAVVASRTDGKPKPQASATASDPASPVLPPETEFPTVTPPPPADPLRFISSAEKDTAPLTPAALLPGSRLALGDRSYAKGATDSTGECASVVSDALGAVLTGNGCRQVLRATYSADGTAVTVGIAVFDTRAEAERAKEQAQGHVRSLPGEGVPAFCRAVACRMTANSVGRYAYFTVSGYTDGRPVPASDTAAKQAAADVNTFAFNRIVQRGRDAAEAEARVGAG